MPRTLRERLVSLLQSDEGLIALERGREEEKARHSSEDLSRKMSEFLSRILSDATAGPDVGVGGESPGEGAGGGRQPRPVVRRCRSPKSRKAPQLRGSFRARIGGRCRARTYDPVIKSHLLYQLS